MADVPPIDLYLNHELMSRVEWSIDPEEVLGGTGRCQLVLQDMLNGIEPQEHWDVRVVIAGSGWILFRGEIIQEGITYELGADFRRWRIDCADYNGEFPQRLVGALDGTTWIDAGFGFFTNIDPFASTLNTDKLTVQQWLDHYIRVDGEAFEAETYVFEYLTNFAVAVMDYKDLQGALETLAALIVENLQFWADPDMRFHWVTIPAWQDLAQEILAVADGGGGSILAGLFPEAAGDGLQIAPAHVAAIVADGEIGFSKLQFTYDGATMPQQIYVRGGTGYVYNAPPIPAVDDTKTVVLTPTAGPGGTYELEIQGSTKLWHVDGTGYISTSFTTVGAGGPWPVQYITVPWSESRHKGGHFWKFLTGPHAGLLADNDTNVFGYGTIEVRNTTPATPGAPKIGIGGSGWALDMIQDPNLRQSYLEAPVSVTKAIRDSIGGQALYRGKFPTLRGSVTARGIDGWRAGQLLRITDDRLPAELNGRYFVVQRVKTRVLPETDVREYQIDWGDGPQSRYSAQAGKDNGPVEWPPPAIKIDISAHDLSPGPNSSQTITGQLVDGSGKAWAIPDKVMNWSFECYDRLGVLQTGQGSIIPKVSITDKNGRARTTLTTGPGDNLVYFVFANVKAV